MINGKPVSIIITGGGAPGIMGTIYSLTNNPDGTKFSFTTTDIKDEPIGKYFSDKFYILPSPESDNYFTNLENIIKKENIKLILPQTTREIMVLSKRKYDLNSIGVSVVVSDFNSIEKANDKYLILKECEEIGVPCPTYFLVKNEKEFLECLDILGYPYNKVVIKPRFSSGLRGLRIITEEITSLDKFLNEKPSELEIDLNSLLKIFRQGSFPEILVEEYLPGDEYTVDVYRNSYDCVAIPRLRKSIRSGISFETIVDLRNDIIEYSKRLANSLNLEYCFGFQFKLDCNGIPKILESNPRIQGTMVASTFAGFNMIYYSVKQALGQNVELNDINIKNNVKFKRYWGGIGLFGEDLLGKI
jgi:carbamoyl-phosphate synthase large subunit